MRQVQIVHPLHDVIGKLVGQREAQPARRAVRGDEVDAGQFRLLAAVERKVGRSQRLFRRDDTAAVALVEPLRLHADLAGCRLAAFQAHAKHLHRVRRIGGLRLGVHAIARVGRAQMRQTGAGQQNTRAVGVIDRREDALVAQSLGEIDLFAVSVFLQQGRQCRVGADCRAGQGIDRCGAFDAARDCPTVAATNRAPPVSSI